MDRWADGLPEVGPFVPVVPVEAAHSIVECLRFSPHSPASVLRTAALVRTWRQSLEEQGYRLDPYPGLIGDGYLWSALGLIALAGSGYKDSDSGIWNVLRRAEANLRAWWLEQQFDGEESR